MTQKEVAALLVARGWAVRKPLTQHRCWKTIELRSLNQCTCYACNALEELRSAQIGTPRHHGGGNLYVTEAGEVLSGHTRREARRVGPQTRKRMLGED